MSITFWCPQAPTEQFVPYPEDEPDYVETRSTLPEVNLSNSNALAMLELMGLGIGPDSYCGTVDADRLADVIERLKRLVADPVQRTPALEPATVNGVPQGPCQDLASLLRMKLAPVEQRGPTVYAGGRSDSYVRSRAQALLAVFEAARAHGFEVVWG